MKSFVAVVRLVFILAVAAGAGALVIATQQRPRVAVRSNSAAASEDPAGGRMRAKSAVAERTQTGTAAPPQAASAPPAKPATPETGGVAAREPAAAPPPAIIPSRNPVQPALESAGLNYALAANGATASGGNGAALLIDGDWTHYDGGSGFASTEWRAHPPDPFIVTLKKTVKIDAIRFLLWDREENRFYQYKLEVSAAANGGDWSTVADRTDKSSRCKGWQLIEFKPRSVRRIRLTGTYNSVNSGFHVVELEAYAGLPRQPGKDMDSLDF